MPATARHILVDTEALCLKLKAETEAGADFADVARRESSCPSRQEGGNLGTFNPGQMVPEFDHAVFTGEVNRLLGPVQTQFGPHGIGGSGDFERNAYLSIFMAPSIAKEGKISTVVPMCSHVDHSEHSVKVIITEQGIADLRGLSPLQRARTIIDNCAHPMYQDYLHRYLENAPGGHIHHDLSHVFDLHRNLIATGSMLG